MRPIEKAAHNLAAEAEAISIRGNSTYFGFGRGRLSNSALTLQSFGYVFVYVINGSIGHVLNSGWYSHPIRNFNGGTI